MATKEVQGFSLSKKYLQTYLFEKYPDIASELKDDAYYNYKKQIMSKMIKLRHEHLEELNKLSSYKIISVLQREDFNLNEHEAERVISGDSNKNDVNLMLQSRLKVIEDEMIKLNKHLKDFA